MSRQSHRLSEGGHIDRSRKVHFTFDGRPLTGHPGDTLASALLANGVHLTGRSFKYHRPRGIYTAGPEEPGALVTLGRGGRSEPNIAATTIEIFDGLEAHSQNRWPSLRFDFMSVNSLLKPFMSAGFYYKTFMWPRSFWYKFYEPAIRRAAGLGALSDTVDPDRYERAHLHADVLIAGAGPAGLAAALEAAQSGARIVLVDEQPEPGGHLASVKLEIGNMSGNAWVKQMTTRLEAFENVRIFRRTTIFGRYDGLTFGALERISDHRQSDDDHPRQRFWNIYTKQFICASGATERPLIFDNNDKPGVMLASAARSYVNRYGVLPGRKILVFTNNDSAYAAARDLIEAGARVSIIDTRPDAKSAHLLGPDADIHFSHAIIKAGGHHHVRAAMIAPLDGAANHNAGRYMDCDLICVSGGWNPAAHLLAHLGDKLVWHEESCCYVMQDPGEDVYVVGGAAGVFDLARSMENAVLTGREAAKACGFNLAEKPLPDFRIEAQNYSLTPFWRLPQQFSDGARSFVDLQNDVTVADLCLAQREGFGRAEHAKRYTTLGMGTDQGKLANVNALGILAQLRGIPLAQTGTTTFRPLTAPVALGAIAGPQRGEEFAPERHSAIHSWHLAQGAVFTHAGLWLRPYYYPRAGEDFAAAVKREVLAVRSSAGMVDVSTLGKIELKGPDAAIFLNRLYINGFSKLPIGRARYGVMLREDGMVFDDGTVSKLGEDHYFITVTTANAAQVMQHMEFCHQVHWPELDIQFCSVSENWAAMAVAGPKSRDVLARVVTGLELSNDKFAFMAVGDGNIGEAFVRIFRISFSGELAYEVYTSAGDGQNVWEAIMEAGEDLGITAYGTEAMTVMRTEKGHVAGPELDGRTSADDLGFGRMMSQQKDYIGRWLARREGFTGAGRIQLVGLKPVAAGGTFKMGAHLVESPGASGPEASQGHVTTSVYSPGIKHFIALALLKNGRSRIGERLYAVSPLHGEQVEVEVVTPVFIDPQGERMRV